MLSLRSALEPPAVDPAFLDRVTALVRAIAHAVEDGVGERGPLLAELEALTGKTYDAYTFVGHDEVSLGVFAEIAARPRAPRLTDVTREELVEVVRRIQTVDITEAEAAWYEEVVYVNTPHPGAVGLMYTDDLTPEEVVDVALAYQPICL